ncbi:transmembrane protein 154 isoform X1 [Paralichthys olivaceus]|uniref:transmembrane protein 154 isoform X1 n=2 Tax=Paralichthys olivaceus TaxID=8255 RepID=UPI003750BE96
MSASRPANMRGPRVKTPLLLLLLLVLISLTGTALCQTEDDDAGLEANAPEEHTEDLEPTVTTETTEIPTDYDAPPAPDPSSTDDQVTEDIYNDGSGTDHTKFDESTSAGIELSGITEDPTPGDDAENLGPIIIAVLVVLVVVIIGVIVCGIFISRKWNSKKRNQELRKEDPYLDGSSTEKVPMPMFEEDVPSVLELEMEEFDQWMAKDSETAEDSNHA